MKYILVFIIFVFFAQPAYALMEIKGTVPTVQPLQQAPMGTKPNVSNNAQYQDPGHPLQTQPEPEIANPNNTQNIAPLNSVVSVPPAKNFHLIFWFFAVVFLVVAGAWGYRRSQ